jgi:hypothetical protein
MRISTLLLMKLPIKERCCVNFNIDIGFLNVYWNNWLYAFCRTGLWIQPFIEIMHKLLFKQIWLKELRTDNYLYYLYKKRILVVILFVHWHKWDSIGTKNNIFAIFIETVIMSRRFSMLSISIVTHVTHNSTNTRISIDKCL